MKHNVFNRVGESTHLLKQTTSRLSYKYPYSIPIVERCSSLVGESYVSRISLVSFSRVIATILLLLYFGVGNVCASVETLTSTEMTSKSSSTALAYNTITQWTDTNVVYVLNAYQNGKSYPWVQIKKPEKKNNVMQAAFIRMRVPTDNKIDSIILVATTATNTSGGAKDIAKHTKFSSDQKVTFYLEKDTTGNGTNPASNTSKHITSVNESAIRDSVHFALKLDTVTTDYDSLWLVTTAATRIWEIKVYYSAVQSCTPLGEINGSLKSPHENRLKQRI